MRRLVVVGLALLAGASMGVKRPPGLADVADVRFWSHDEFTRVVVELSSGLETDLQAERLGPAPSAGRPERLYLDLPGVWVGRRFESGLAVGDGLLRAVRLGQNTLRRTRVVLDLERYERHRVLVLQAPPRVVLDVYADRQAPARIRPRLPTERLGVPLRRLSPSVRPVERVILDPGHGGEDPGAVGLGGLLEKDVNLRLARRLAAALERRGFEVALTREDDRTLDLEERTARAEALRGDLFISLHANASRRRSARGFEVYYLDAGHTRHSLRVAARENGVRAGEMDSLQRALARLRVGELSGQGRRLAGLVHDAVHEEVPIPNLGVKRAPFYVLFLSSMPAILVEAGFVTNGHDVERLRNDGHLEELAEGIARGLVRYRATPLSLASEARP